MTESNEKEKEVEGEEPAKRDDNRGGAIGNGEDVSGDYNNPHNKGGGGKVAATKENDLSHVTSFEDLMDYVGTRGRWNLLLFLLCCLTSYLAALQTLSYQFVGATPDYWCHVEPLVEAGWTPEQILDFAIPVDETGKRESCLMYDLNYTLAARLGFEAANTTLRDSAAPSLSCYTRDFNYSQYQSTVTTEWDLVCERRALYSTTQSAAQIGRLVGCLFLGYLIDVYGRRLIVLLCAAVSIASAFGCVVAPNVEVYIFLKVVVPLANSGTFLGTFVLMMETSGTTERTRMGILCALAWAFGYVCVPGFAYFIRSWKWLQAAFAIPTLLLIAYYWVLPESPRWLILQGRHQEALKVLKWATKVNRRTLPPDPPVLAAMQRLHAKVLAEQATASDEPDREGARVSKWRQAARWTVGVLKEYTAVLRMREMRCRALVVFYCWFASALVYYGISLNATNISANIYLYVLLGGIMEFPCYLVLWPMVAYFGRVKSLAILNFLCGAAILVLTVLIYSYPEAPIGLIMFFSLLGKFGVTAGFTLIWMFTLELFPTRYRSLITGQASVSARVGSISSPYINDLLGELIVWAPSAVFCVISMLAGGLSLLLPETTGRSMPEGYSFQNEPNTKGSTNQAYLPDSECPSRETAIAFTNKDTGQPNVGSEAQADTHTKM